MKDPCTRPQCTPPCWCDGIAPATGNGTGLDSPLWVANWSPLTWATLAIIAVAVALASAAF